MNTPNPLRTRILGVLRDFDHTARERVVIADRLTAAVSVDPRDIDPRAFTDDELDMLHERIKREVTKRRTARLIAICDEPRSLSQEETP